ncbi:MAG: hypothetical protein JWR68_1382 [Polaromonas sp.]|nr:hypothetical protein [Polaromonas sp.]
MKKATNTTNEKAFGLPSKGFEKYATNALDSTGSTPAQLELKPALKTNQPAGKTRKYGLKSTSTEAQYERSIILLRTGEKSTIDLRRAGVMCPAARIKELNDRYGYNIVRVAAVIFGTNGVFVTNALLFTRCWANQWKGGQHHD